MKIPSHDSTYFSLKGPWLFDDIQLAIPAPSNSNFT